MEDVWKDINVPSLQGEDPPFTNFQGVKLQDFLDQPFAENNHHSSTATHDFNLNSYPNFNFDQPSLSTSSNATPFEDFGSNSDNKKRLNDHVENVGDRRHKRMLKNRESAARSRARKQECICPLLPFALYLSYQNAYRYELEGEIEILRQENERLKKQQEINLSLESLKEAPPPPTKKNPLCRSSTV
ncbi:BZIP domain-containing protein [Heracleum sosnowskyi]|uniref:BZIP domain-containing protein n=1 Tax=Heracleum sosnowskyi TaxID=360622 RepID=A0AAD8IIY6_9APIA|nr:BZIP domain-containing protein [Heracleum sosnowskyi]